MRKLLSRFERKHSRERFLITFDRCSLDAVRLNGETLPFFDFRQIIKPIWIYIKLNKTSRRVQVL